MEFQCTEDDALSHDELMMDEAENNSGPPPEDLSDFSQEEEHIEAIERLNLDEGLHGGLNGGLGGNGNLHRDGNPHRDGNDDPLADSLHPPTEPPRNDSPEPSSSQNSRPDCSQDSNQPIPESPQPSEEPSENRRRSIAAVRIPDSLSDAGRFDLPLSRYSHPLKLLVPNPEHLKSIESQSKSFGMVPPQDLPIHAGVTWSIVDMCTAPSLTPRMIEAISWFARINALASNYCWNDYVVPTLEVECTNSTKLKPLFASNGKDIKGVVLEEIMDRDAERSAAQESLDDILLADDTHELAEGDVQTSLPFLTIEVSFTAAVFRNDGGSKDEIALFGVVRATCLLNVEAFDFITVGFSFVAVCCISLH